MSLPIPQPPGIPLLGNIFSIDPKNTWLSLNELAAKYGPIFKIKALGTQIVFIASSSLLTEICDETRFRKCVTGPVVEIRHAVHDGLFTAYDHEEMWGVAHRIMAPMLSKRSVDECFTGMREAAGEVVGCWKGVRRGEKVDLLAGLKRGTLRAVMGCFFNQGEGGCMGGVEPPMIGAMDRATAEAMVRPTRLRVVNWLFYQRAFDRDTRVMREFGKEVVRRRRGEGGSRRKDMLDALLNGRDPETGKGLNDERVVDEIISLCIGTATAPNLVAFALFYLLKNQGALEKGCAEIDEVLGETGELTLERLGELRYCEAILRESIRLSAAAPGFNIEPIPSTDDNTGSITLAGGKYQIPRNQTIIAILAAVNRDPEVFEEPEMFRPERMQGKAFDALPVGVKKWFGNGKRECIGRVFGWRWAMVLLVSVLREVELRLVDGGKELSIQGAFSVGPVGLWAFAGERDGGVVR